jgi:pyrroline-5-carboxylate reductase
MEVESMSSSSINQKICFIGGGSMAEAIIKGMIDQQTAPIECISVVNRSDNDRLEELTKRYGIQIGTNDQARNDLIKQSNVIVLAMKPKDAGSALQTLAPLLNKNQLLVSVIAGLTITTIQQALNQKLPVARTMPNTSSTIGKGTTGISFSEEVSQAQIVTANAMFNSIGIVKEVEEAKLDIVTGLSGSGPAYIYYMMEALIKAGIQGGLDEETARSLTVQTVLGAAEMVNTTKAEPSELRGKVTSPGGTTQAAIETMDELGFQSSIIQAVLRAKERAEEMGSEITESIRSQAAKL